MALQVDQYLTFNPFFIGKLIFRPDPVVHEFVDVFLQGFKNLLVGALNLTGKHLNITPEFLCHSRKIDQSEQQCDIK
jgi:hypothetical protein